MRPNHIPHTLTTQRLTVRPYASKDLKRFQQLMSDEAVTRYLKVNAADKTATGAKALFDMVLTSYRSNHPFWVLTIARRLDDIFIGSCGLIFEPGDSHVECYYALLSEYWGQGYATEALNALLKHGFVHLGLKRVDASMHIRNSRSLSVAAKAGLKLQPDGCKSCQHITDVHYKITFADYIKREQSHRME